MALVLALGITVVLGMVGTTVIAYTTANQGQASRSHADESALSLAEAGINNAMSVLANPSNNAICDPQTTCTALLPDALVTANVSTYDTGYVKWWGTFDPLITTWTLHAYAYVRNPTGPSAGLVIRRISAQVKVRPSLMQPLNNPAWNYIMATRTGTPGGCDETLDNSVNIQSPMYVMGNLCLNTPSQITGGPLLVKGSAKLDVNTNIGSAASPINEAHVRNGCTYKGSAYAAPCTPTEKVWASISDANPADVTAPQANFPSWYLNATPGPRWGCTESSGTVPVFDNDTSWNNSVLGAFNLTPSSTSYSCVVKNGNGATVGQLSWDSSAKVLTILGTVFIDGSVTVNYGFSNVPIQYNGKGTIYVGGSLLISNTKLCGGISDGSCDFNAWNPNTEMLVFVTGGSGGQVPSGDGVQIVSSYFQGALWSTYSIELDTTSQTEGPMVAGNEIFGNSVLAHSWPVITEVPAGMPGNPTVYAQPDPPRLYSY